MMRKRYWRLATLLLYLAATTANGASLLVDGTGSSEPIVRLLFEEFHKQTPEAELRHLSPPLGSGGALNALAERFAALLPSAAAAQLLQEHDYLPAAP